jgi:hypothetical protein
VKDVLTLRELDGERIAELVELGWRPSAIRRGSPTCARAAAC